MRIIFVVVGSATSSKRRKCKHRNPFVSMYGREKQRYNFILSNGLMQFRLTKLTNGRRSGTLTNFNTTYRSCNEAQLVVGEGFRISPIASMICAGPTYFKNHTRTHTHKISRANNGMKVKNKGVTT